MKTYIKQYFLNNYTEYAKLIIIMAITIIVSILTINNSNDYQKKAIKEYIDSKIVQVKNSDKFEKNNSLEYNLKEKVKENIIVSLLASSIIGLPIAYLIIIKRVFSIGYTLSAIFATQSKKTAIIFICSSMLLHNIIYVVSLFIALVTGLNFIKSIVKKEKLDLKFEILRFIIFILISALIAMISVLIQVFISLSLINLFKKNL